MCSIGKMQTTQLLGSVPGAIHVVELCSQNARFQIINTATPWSVGTKDFILKRHGIKPQIGSNRCRSIPSTLGAKLVCNAISAIHFTDNFDSIEQEQWKMSRKHVEELGFNSNEADDVLAKSFGWSYSNYWGEEKEATIPNPDVVLNNLLLLKDLGLDLVALVKKFPEVVGLTNQEIQTSLATLDSSWGIAGKNLKNVLMRNPQVLGYYIDCKGDCMGECTRCWVRF